MKISPYNHIPSTYDGRHAMMSNEELRNYFERMQKRNSVWCFKRLQGGRNIEYA